MKLEETEKLLNDLHEFNTQYIELYRLFKIFESNIKQGVTNVGVNVGFEERAEEEDQKVIWFNFLETRYVMRFDTIIRYGEMVGRITLYKFRGVRGEYDLISDLEYGLEARFIELEAANGKLFSLNSQSDCFSVFINRLHDEVIKSKCK